MRRVRAPIPWVDLLVLAALSVAAYLMFASIARASPATAVVQLSNGCSGWIASPDGLVITAKHCQESTPIRATVPGKGSLPIEPVATSPNPDGAAAYRLPAGQYDHLVTSATPVNVGDPVTSYGHPDMGPLMVGTGSITGSAMIITPVVNNGYRSDRYDGVLVPGHHLMTTNLRTRGGWSGGPLLNSQGEAVGALSGGTAGPEYWGVDSLFTSQADLLSVMRQASQPKQQGIVFGSDGCSACVRLIRDYQAGLITGVDLKFIKYDPASQEWQRFVAECNPPPGEIGLPITWIPGAGYVKGYRDASGLMEWIGERLRLGIRGTPPVAVVPPYPAGVVPVEPVPLQPIPDDEPKVDKLQAAIDEIASLKAGIEDFKAANGLAKVREGLALKEDFEGLKERLGDVKADPRSYLFGIIGLFTGPLYRRFFRA